MFFSPITCPVTNAPRIRWLSIESQDLSAVAGRNSFANSFLDAVSAPNAKESFLTR